MEEEEVDDEDEVGTDEVGTECTVWHHLISAPAGRRRNGYLPHRP